MGERPTKERLDEIRRDYPDTRPNGDPSTVKRDVLDLLAEIDAVTRERDTMGASLRDDGAPVPMPGESARAYARRRGPLDGADAQALEGALAMTERERDKDRADLAETRAQLARLREVVTESEDATAAGDVARDASESGYNDAYPPEMGYEERSAKWNAALDRECEAVKALRAALSEPGPTLASIRAEALRAAADRLTTPDDIRMWLRQRADEIEAGRG